MDIKMMVIQRAFDMSGDVIAGLLSKPDWEARARNIEQYYKNLEPIKNTLPDAPVARENPGERGENGKVDKIVGEVCTSDLSPKELFECKSCVGEVVEGSSDVIQKYFKPSL